MRFPALKASSTRTWRGGTGTAGAGLGWDGAGAAAPLEAALGAGAVAAGGVALLGRRRLRSRASRISSAVAKRRSRSLRTARSTIAAMSEETAGFRSRTGGNWNGGKGAGGGPLGAGGLGG